MLSPASLRVCCLTVMAPALTKADRRADCLPVVLSDPFCASKTSDSQNSEDRVSALSATKLPCKSAFLIRRRKAWVGTPVRSTVGFFPKIRFSVNDTKSIFYSSSVRTNADIKSKIWQSTKVTTALADRVKLKYTMSKNSNSLKNMGLAKANTSLGLQNLKKMNRISQLQNEKENPLRLLVGVGDSPPDLPDSTNSELQGDLTITEIFQPVTDHAAEDVVSSSDGDVFVPCSSSKVEMLPSVFDNGTSAVAVTCTNSVLTSSVTDCIIPPLTCSSQLTVHSSISDSVSALPVAVKDAGGMGLISENGSISSGSTEDVSVALESVASCELPNADVNVASLSLESNSPLRTDATLENSELLSEERLETNTSKCSVSDLPESSEAVMSPLPPPSTDGLILSSASEDNQETEQSKSGSIDVTLPSNDTSASPSSCNLLLPSEENIATEPLKYSPSDLPLPSTSTSASSVASEDCLELHPFTDVTCEILMIPEALQNSTNSTSFKEVEASTIFLNTSLVDLGSKMSTTVPIVDKCSTTKKVLSYQNSLVPNTEKRTFCCPVSSKDLKSIEKLLLDGLEKTSLSKEQSLLLLSKHMNAHVKKELRNFVEHYQRKFNIPCQRQVRNSNPKPGKELVDLKAELLQSEDVKNLSTAALVSLVRKLESSGSPGKLLPQQNSFSQTSELASTESVDVTFDPEEHADIKHTSNMLLTSMRNLLKSVDSDETDDSDEDMTMEEEKDTEACSPLHKILYGKYLKKRAALERRSTWLISRIHEIEYLVRILNGALKKECLVEGDVCFVNQAHSLSVADLDNASEQTAAVKTKVKSLIKQVNGYLDHSSLNSAVCVAHADASSSHSLHFEKDSTHAPPSLLDDDESCSRTRPLKTSSFRKRKFLPTTGLHLTNNKLSRLSTISCDCNSQNVMHPCILCTGRYNCKQSVDPDSMPLPDRIALLDPTFHPVLSFEKDIPWELHVGAVFKKTESRYQPLQPSPISNQRRLRLGVKPKHFSGARSHTRKLNRYARSLLSAKYRNKHVRSSKHLRKHGLVFGKWRRLQNKSFHMRERMRRISVASSASSHDSPVASPLSVYEDGLDQSKKRRDDNQFDIDDVIIPCNSKSGRLVDIQYKEILIPSWRYIDVADAESNENVESNETEEIEDISDAVYIKRHERLEVEEKKMLRSSASGLTGMNRRGRRHHRCDSRADSSGANTPDPVLLYNQDIMFQVPNSIITAGPSSPAVSPPTTPSSATVMSDDSQPSFGNGSLARYEKRKFTIQKKPSEESAMRNTNNDCDDVQPYEPHKFPLSDKEYEELLAESTHLCTEDTDITLSVPSFPASPESSTSSTSTVEEDEDITDPEWTVVKRDNGPDQALVLKFAKR